MDGFEVMQHLQNDEDLRTTPVVAATASALKEDEELIRSICEGYLPKPINKQDLLDELKKHLICKVPPRSKNSNKPITKIQFEKISELRSQCEEVVNPTIAKLKKNPSSVNLMLDLTTNLKKLATLYPIKNFIEWQDAVQDACDVYDIGRLEKLIRFSDEVLEKLSYD